MYGTSTHHAIPSQVCFGAYSFDGEGDDVGDGDSIPTTLPGRMWGELHNANTLETFKAFPTTHMLEQAREKMWKGMLERIPSSAAAAASSSSSSTVASPRSSSSELLSHFLLLTYADLKTHKYVYWFCFTALVLDGVQIASNGQSRSPIKGATTPVEAAPPSDTTVTSPSTTNTTTDQLSTTSFHQLIQAWQQRKDVFGNFFVVRIETQQTNDGGDGEDTLTLLELDAGLEEMRRAVAAQASSIPSVGRARYLLSFLDPSRLEGHMGWPARNLITYAFMYGSLSTNVSIPILSFRDSEFQFQSNTTTSSSSSNFSSRIFHITLTSKHTLEDLKTLLQQPKGVGWERNMKTNKLSPKTIDLGSMMDPLKLAESSVDLNLKLMRWRALPELNLTLLSTTKCLLLGSGTLGCAVGRCLLGWGIRDITFVDSGKVSYSNPVRQSLFEFTNARDGLGKAECASEAMKRIYPLARTRGIELSIPMVGHQVSSPQEEAEVRSSIRKLEDLIEGHDAIFLLTDSRESRWTPTVIAAAKNKIVMNTALGFDTYLVMRHGDNHGSKRCEAFKSAGIELQTNASGSNSASSASTSATTTTGGSLLTDPNVQLGCYFCNDVVAPTDVRHHTPNKEHNRNANTC